jgi:hydroxymethylglutaryl-CoA lyase
MSEPVTIYEVGPRDGLQNEPRRVPTAQKIELIERLADGGLRWIEVSSFVSPSWVPQLSDATDVFAGITRRPGVVYSALVPNMTGYNAARAAAVDEIAVFTAASETFCRSNINCSIDESFARFAPIVEAAHGDAVPVRGYVSCATDCPFEGPIAPERVAEVAGRLLAIGCREISLGDTIGRGTPERVDAMLAAVLDVAPPGRLAGHFHDTSGLALANVEVALERGVRVFDAACGGLGGCPYAPGAAGNLATERLVSMLSGLGYFADIDEGKLASAAEFARSLRSSPP